MQSKTSSSDPVRMPLLSGTLFRKNLTRFWPLWGLAGLVAALYDSRSVSREELAELRVFLDEAMGKEGDV